MSAKKGHYAEYDLMERAIVELLGKKRRTEAQLDNVTTTEIVSYHNDERDDDKEDGESAKNDDSVWEEGLAMTHVYDMSSLKFNRFKIYYDDGHINDCWTDEVHEVKTALVDLETDELFEVCIWFTQCEGTFAAIISLRDVDDEKAKHIREGTLRQYWDEMRKKYGSLSKWQ